MLQASFLPLAVWELTSAGMLPWLAAALLPWLVHRLLQRPERSTDWAAVELLLAAIQRRSRQLNLQQWLLLAIRTAIIVLLVIAAAGPIYHRFAIGSQAGTQNHFVLVFDRSLSMSVEEAGRSRFQRAQEAAKDLVTASDGKDAFSIVAWDQTAEEKLGRPSFDTERVLAAISELNSSHSRAELPAALDALASILDQAEKELPTVSEHKVVFLSDRSQATWSLQDPIRTSLQSLMRRANLSVIDLDDSHRDNLMIASLRVEPKFVVQDRSLEIVAAVRSHERQSRTELTVEMMVDGRRVSGQQIDLPTGQEREVRFGHAFVGAGKQVVEVSLSSTDDALSLDDRRRLLVDVRPKLRVACVAGYPGAADDVARALNPGGKPQSLFAPEAVSLGRLSELRLNHYDAVFLCSVEQLSRRETLQLSRYVQQGGSLAVLLGTAEPGPELASLLPMEVTSELATGEFRFDPLDYEHPIVRAFQGSSSAGLLGTTINKYAMLRPKNPSNGFEEVLAFDSGDPALLVHRTGQGRVAVFALPATLRFSDPAATPWSTFPVSPSYLPIIREVVSYLVGDNWLEQHNLQVGQKAVLANVQFDSSGPRQLLTPSGKSLPVYPSATEPLLVEANEAGVYSLISDSLMLPLLAVNPDPRESDLSMVEGPLLPAGSSDLEQVALGPAGHRWGGTSLAGMLLVLTFAMLLVESSLAWWLGRSWG